MCDMWYVILDTSTCHATPDPDSWHRYLPCYTWPVTSHTGTQYLHWYTVFTLTCDMLHLIWYSWLWHLVFTPALNIWTRHSRYDILDTCTWHMVYDMFSCGTNTWTWHLDPWPDITPLIPVLYDIFMTITFTGTWHDYYIITRYLVLLNSCTPELLYTWTPKIGRILTLLLILYSCWPP